MNLIVETFYNNALFEEIFAMMRAIGAPIFGCLLYLKEHTELHSAKVKKIIEDFEYQTSKDLFSSMDEARAAVLTPETIERYVGGELGINELLIHKALLFKEMDDISSALYNAAIGYLREIDLLTPAVNRYIEALQRFIAHRKKDSIFNTNEVGLDEFRFDFKAIAQLEYRVNPNNLPIMETPVRYAFFHDKAQQNHIAKQLELFMNTPIGLGRLIQRSNLKLMYRRFETVGYWESSAAAEGNGKGLKPPPWMGEISISSIER